DQRRIPGCFERADRISEEPRIQDQPGAVRDDAARSEPSRERAVRGWCQQLSRGPRHRKAAPDRGTATRAGAAGRTAVGRGALQRAGRWLAITRAAALPRPVAKAAPRWTGA